MRRGKGEGQMKGRGGKGLLWNYMKSCILKLFEIVKHYRIERTFNSIKKTEKKRNRSNIYGFYVPQFQHITY